MPHAARTALVLQGGGALGAYELGAARRLYEDDGFAPDLIAGVSIGAITAVLLARPAEGLRPLAALERFWRQVGLDGWFLPSPLRPYVSVFGIPNFFVPRRDLLTLASWTSLYDTAPARQLLEKYVDLAALRTSPVRLLLSAVNVETGELEVFDSRSDDITMEHILASGSLPRRLSLDRY